MYSSKRLFLLLKFSVPTTSSALENEEHDNEGLNTEDSFNIDLNRSENGGNNDIMPPLADCEPSSTSELVPDCEPGTSQEPAQLDKSLVEPIKVGLLCNF